MKRRFYNVVNIARNEIVKVLYLTDREAVPLLRVQCIVNESKKVKGT
jgi:hypothetical protein